MKTGLSLLVLVGLLAACGGGGSSFASLHAVFPAAIPQSLASTLQVAGNGFLAEGGLALEIGGSTFALVVIDDHNATAAIPAGALAPGAHDLRLVAGGRASPPMRNALTVNAQPVLASFDPPVVDRNVNTPFVIHGTGFLAPVMVECHDPTGLFIAPPAEAEVHAGGTELHGTTPMFPGLGGPMTVTVQIVNGDGQRAVAAIQSTYDCTVCGYRTIDGAGNNETLPDLGRAGTQLLRLAAPAYADGVAALAGAARPGPRTVSNAVCAQTGEIPNTRLATDMLWQWGQFVDHDLDLTPAAAPPQPAPIAVPSGDIFFDPLGTGTVTIGFNRSTSDPATGLGPGNPRQQTNVITAFLDASNVYGSDTERARALRTLDGTGRLRTSAGDLLPFNTAGLPNAPDAGIPTLFLAGDVRANEQVGLTSLHVLFVREHNRLAQQIRTLNPGLSGDMAYEAARRLVGAQIQVITYREFLPALLGAGALAPYAGYDPAVDPGIANEFSTAAYRLGHTMLSPEIKRLDAQGGEIAAGHLALRDAFFDPSRIVDEGGIDPILRGLASHAAQEVDVHIVDDVRNFLFGPPGAGGFDLASLNLQRGRDHGLPGYNDVREQLGLARKTSFAEVSSDAAVQARLAAAYATVDELDAWIGGLAEDHAAGAMVGELFLVILKDQFERLRDGDRFWYQRAFTGAALAELEGTTLADVVRRNTAIGSEFPDDPFHVAGAP